MKSPWRHLNIGERVHAYAQHHPHLEFTYTLIRRVIARQGKAQIGLSAAGVAFWFIIAVFPALIATLALLGIILDPTQLDSLIDEVNKLSPGSFGAAVLEQVQRSAQNTPSAVSWALIISLSVSAWSTSSGIYNLSRGIRLAYALPPRNYLVARLRAFGGSYLLILFLATVALGVAIGSSLLTNLAGYWRPIGFITLALSAFGLLLLVMLGLFRYGIGRGGPHLRLFPGAAFAAVGLLVVYVALSFALGLTTRYQAVYGALAGTIVVMLVLYVASYVMLIGALINGQWQPTRNSLDAAQGNASVTDSTP
ncbi:MAG: YihY/virulence factor BrkB family protein [Candidatus Nanopelagicales bacterium]